MQLGINANLELTIPVNSSYLYTYSTPDSGATYDVNVEVFNGAVLEVDIDVNENALSSTAGLRNPCCTEVVAGKCYVAECP